MSVESLFNNVYNLPSIPKVVQELTESFGSDKANADEIANKIAKDQAFAAKVLRLANSARYGVGRKIASISNAVVLLGISQLRTLVTASGMTSAFALSHVAALASPRASSFSANVARALETRSIAA